ncbi:hypothetical protein QQF64_025629, partial [Cirrhinus molitorella]
RTSGKSLATNVMAAAKVGRKRQSPIWDFFDYDSVKNKSKCLVVEAGDTISQQKNTRKNMNKIMNNLFYKLHLEGRDHNKLRPADVLQVTEHSLQSHKSCAEEQLIQTFLQKLLMMDYRARYIK